MTDKKYMDAARRVMEIRLAKEGKVIGPEHDKLISDIARGVQSLCKTFMVGHANGTAAPGNLTGGAALVQESIGDSQKMKKLRKLRRKLMVAKAFVRSLT